MISFGAGFNTRFLSHEESDRLPLPPGVSYIEMGFREFSRWRSENHPDIGASLHLSRSPIADEPVDQDAFLAYVAAQTHEFELASIGLHLTGPQASGIGRFGFSSHYMADPVSEKNAIRFIEALRTMTGAPVWIENANFYSADAREVLRCWASVKRILDKTGTRLIVDLAHLVIEARNLGLDPADHLGLPPWDLVKELHLSGIVQGPDGALHDGHANPVHPEVWSLLSRCLTSFGLIESDIVITVEHTDPDWGSKRDSFYSDFAAAQAAVSKAAAVPPRSRQSDATRYALGNLLRLSCQRVPKLKAAVEQRGLNLRTLLDDYLEDALGRRRRRLVLSLEEVPPPLVADAEEAIPGFVEFVKERLRGDDSRR